MFSIKSKIKFFLEKNRIKRKFKKAKSVIHKPLELLNTKYVTVGKGVRVKDNVRINCYDRFGTESFKPDLIIGDSVIINHNCTMFCTDSLIIGNNTIFAENVFITTENHGTNPEIETPYHAQNLSSKSVSIGEGCWIGEKVSILPGSIIGKKCIIGANAVVNGNIPDYTIAVGVPARVIKKYNFELHCWEKV